MAQLSHLIREHREVFPSRNLSMVLWLNMFVISRSSSKEKALDERSVSEYFRTGLSRRWTMLKHRRLRDVEVETKMEYPYELFLVSQKLKSFSPTEDRKLSVGQSSYTTNCTSYVVHYF